MKTTMAQYVTVTGTTRGGLRWTGLLNTVTGKIIQRVVQSAR